MKALSMRRLRKAGPVFLPAGLSDLRTASAPGPPGGSAPGSRTAILMNSASSLPFPSLPAALQLLPGAVEDKALVIGAARIIVSRFVAASAYAAITQSAIRPSAVQPSGNSRPIS